MAKHHIIRRYTLEIEKVRQNHFPSMSDLIDYIEDHDLQASERTISRDFNHIRNEFNVSIEYDRDRDGYFIEKEKEMESEAFFRFLEIVNTAEILSNSLTDSKNTLEYISFDSAGGFIGIENLKSILGAIQNKRKITFEHLNFHQNKTKKHTLQPYLLKEYMNRWYVVGLLGKYKDFTTFGIDRISNLEVTATTFKRDKKLNPKEKFEQTIGLVYTGNEPQKVILSYTPTQGKYVKSLPLHSSQQILEDNDKELQISIYVIPNYELTQKILADGFTVKVLAPKWLAKEIKESLGKALKLYSKG